MVHTLRQQRGYRFETRIIEVFTADRDWNARRLGGSSTGLPDIVITNNGESVLYAVEAKSTVGKLAYVENDQLCRCLDILEMFSIYKKRSVVLAFKFAESKHNDRLRYFFFRIIPHKDLRDIKSVRCSSEGKLKIKSDTIPHDDIRFSYSRFDTIKSWKEMWRISYMFQY